MSTASLSCMKTKQQLYFYKLTTDNGGAPCTYRGLLSLAICKPRIRKGAGKGDWIFGFGSKELGEKLIYVAQVKEDLDWKTYSLDYGGRPDCIYRWTGRGFRWKSGKKYHNPKETGDQRPKDVGSNARVLFSTNFRYLGINSIEIPRNLPLLRAAIKKLKQNHRVNHTKALTAELRKMRNFVFTSFRRKKAGHPTNWKECHLRCN